MTKHIAKHCSRWDHCSVNNCPLDPNEAPTDWDKHPKCTMAKANRMRVAARFPGALPMAGMTAREFGGWTRYQSMTPEAKAAMAERGRSGLSKFRG